MALRTLKKARLFFTKKLSIFAVIFRTVFSRSHTKPAGIRQAKFGMRNGLTKVTLLLLLLGSSNLAHAQNGSSSSNYLIYILLALAVLVFFALVVQVSDNLLNIEAKQIGAEKPGGSFSLFPDWSELIPSNLPEYVNGQLPVFALKKGYNISLEGEASSEKVEEARAKTYAVQPPNFVGLKPIPKLLVEEGDEVKAGDPLFFDKNMPDVKFCAPVSGEVIAINRGAKRAITEVVILADKTQKFREYESFDLEKSSRQELVSYLLESGVWPMIRQRPFNVVPDPEEAPRDIFITTFDTAPLAPDLNLIVEGRGEDFQKGLDVLNKLTEGAVHLSLDARKDEAPSAIFTEAGNVKKYWFKGKHPAGNVSVQIHHIKPIGPGDKIWVLGVQEVITLGALFQQGKFVTERVVALTGSELKEPKYVRTHLGANLSDLLQDNLANDHVRIISGDVLSGDAKKEDSFLNFFDDQVTVIEEGDDFEMFGWLIPSSLRPTISRTFPNFLLPGDIKFKVDTNTHGEKRAFVVTHDYEKVLPMDIHTQQLMKAILINDFEQMEGLGIQELSEEDVAICEFVCTSKQPLQQILRQGLDTMREQG